MIAVSNEWDFSKKAFINTLSVDWYKKKKNFGSFCVTYRFRFWVSIIANAYLKWPLFGGKKNLLYTCISFKNILWNYFLCLSSQTSLHPISYRWSYFGIRNKKQIFQVLKKMSIKLCNFTKEDKNSKILDENGLDPILLTQFANHPIRSGI